jgi:anti-anti-sigma factor
MATTSDLTVAPGAVGGAALLRIAGEIDLSNVHLLLVPLQEHIDQSAPELTVDLREVVYMDSAAIKVLLRTAAELSRQGRRLRAKVTPYQQRLFVLTGCDHLLALEAA